MTTARNVVETVNCITKVLPVFIGRDERANEAAAAARALSGVSPRPWQQGPSQGWPGGQGARHAVQASWQDALVWQSQCFQNPRADEATKKLAQRVAPKSPAAMGYKPSPKPATEQVHISHRVAPPRRRCSIYAPPTSRWLETHEPTAQAHRRRSREPQQGQGWLLPPLRGRQCHATPSSRKPLRREYSRAPHQRGHSRPVRLLGCRALQIPARSRG